MKHFYLVLSVALLCMACSKDKFDRSDPKNGQEVDLFLDHYTTGTDVRVFYDKDKKESTHTYVDKFSDRELGYTYMIRAKVVRPKDPPQDGASYWFEYIRTISSDKYQGTDTLAFPLFGASGPFNYFCLRKEAGKYYYNTFPLTAFDDQVKEDLAKALETGPSLMETWPRSMTIYVLHDPANYTKGYIVYKVALK